MNRFIQLLTILLLTTTTINAQNVGIGIATPDASAKLDITSTNSGVLIPRIALSLTTTAAPVAAPANSLLVYNTATAGDVTPGFYYWSSTSSAWTRLGGTAGWDIIGNNGITAANFLGTINAADLIVRTTNTERMRVLSTGNVGINVAAPAAILDVTSANSGVLIPRVALTSKALAGPVTVPVASMLVYNTATALAGTANAVTPGHYYWSGSAWIRITGDGWQVGTSTATTNAIGAANSIGYLGTSTNSHVDLVSNNQVRGRLSNLGEFFIGTTNTTLPGDLMNGVSNAAFPWAINGYSGFNGAGVYGSIESGTTLFAGVQGEYKGTGAQGAGVRGLNISGTAGTDFGACGTGVNGSVAGYVGSYKFGVYGSGGTNSRSGGVMGYDYGVAMGALGYYASNGLDYAVYGFGLAHANGVAAGRLAQDGSANGTTLSEVLDVNNYIGLGIYGGVMGGWVRGLKYGFNTKGETYSMYIDGNGYTNKPFAYLVETDGGERVPNYMAGSLQPEVTTKGKTMLENGRVFVAFDNNFKKIISNVDDLIITATPQGNTNGVYIDQITADGFWIYENAKGTSSVKVAWMASCAIKGQENPEVPAELLSKEFDVKMNGVMFNENDTENTAQPMWWDGTQMRWDTPPAKDLKKNAIDNHARPTTIATTSKATLDK